MPQDGNNGEETNEVFDDMLAKIEGLQRAVGSASIILNIKAMIVEKKNLANVTINPEGT